MGEELEGDLTETTFWGADLSRSRFRDVDLTGVRISHAFVRDVEVDAIVDRLVVNGVDVTAFVHEHDPWHGLREAQLASTAAQLRDAWERLLAAWRALGERARSLGGDAFERQVDGEWSLSETLRHLVFVLDKWWAAPIAGRPFSSIGLPNTGSRGFPWPGLALDHPVALGEVVQVSGEQAAALSQYLAEVTDADLDHVVEVLENGPHDVRHCLQTVMEEAFWHLRYADRDLRAIAGGAGA
jgi:hypothetical protein